MGATEFGTYCGLSVIIAFCLAIYYPACFNNGFLSFFLYLVFWPLVILNLIYINCCKKVGSGSGSGSGGVETVAQTNNNIV
jgi:hypothetical protein